MKRLVKAFITLLAVTNVSCSKSNDVDQFDPNSSTAIEFEDNAVAKLCIENFDLNGDNELSYKEASSVIYLKDIFKNNQDIFYFDELKYFIGLKSINSQFWNCGNLRKVTIPKYVEDSKFAFRDCDNLSHVTLMDGLTSIGAKAFQKCALKVIDIPASVTSIGLFAFEYCYSEIVRGHIVAYINGGIRIDARKITAEELMECLKEHPLYEQCIVSPNDGTLCEKIWVFISSFQSQIFEYHTIWAKYLTAENHQILSNIENNAFYRVLNDNFSIYNLKPVIGENGGRIFTKEILGKTMTIDETGYNSMISKEMNNLMELILLLDEFNNQL